MNYLSNDNIGIQFEAFMLLGVWMKHVDKLESEDVRKIITKNKSKLINFVKEFKKEEEAEYSFNREMLLHQLDNLKF